MTASLIEEDKSEPAPVRKALRKNGHGFLKWDDGSTYEGYWLDDKRHGQGVYKWSTGEVLPYTLNSFKYAMVEGGERFAIILDVFDNTLDRVRVTIFDKPQRSNRGNANKIHQCVF